MVSMRLGVKDNSRKKELEAQEWYHGFRSRKDVSVLICEPGAFLLRATDSTNFTTIVISVMNEKRELHHLTIVFANGLWQLGVLKDKGKNARGFKTIVELVNHYKAHPLPIKTTLKKAVTRPSWLIKHVQVSFEEKIRFH
ncbi:unnamed protein product [Auanema sp. JU1783]|nr:unnamed protein product [Auanema sp. JU1783]